MDPPGGYWYALTKNRRGKWRDIPDKNKGSHLPRLYYMKCIHKRFSDVAMPGAIRV